MRRRHLLAAVAGLALCAPGIGRAAGRPVVAILRAGAWAPPRLRGDLVAGLRGEGFEEGRDYEIVYRSAEGDPAREPALVAEMVGLNPSVILVQTTGLAVAAHKATSTIPIVASALYQPLKFGLIESFRHPGGNVTGLAAISASAGKVIELLVEVVPGVTRIGVLFNPANPAQTVGLAQLREELAGQSVTLLDAPARTPAEIEQAFDGLKRDGAQALLVGQDALFTQEIKRVAALALAARLPSTFGFRDLPDEGGLMSYGASQPARWYRLGWYVAQILRGEKPGELPVEQPEKLELVINMKTAKSLGLTIPPVLLTRAELIE